MEDLEVSAARAGDNVRLRVKGIEEEDVSTGFVLCNPNKPIHTGTRFQAQLLIVEHKSIICAGYSAVMHANAAVEEVTLTV
jgi:peptide chain release factor subunit 3